MYKREIQRCSRGGGDGRNECGPFSQGEIPGGTLHIKWWGCFSKILNETSVGDKSRRGLEFFDPKQRPYLKK